MLRLAAPLAPLALSACLAAAPVAHADEKPRPVAQVDAGGVEQPRYAMVYAGAALFASSWLPTVAASIGTGEATLAVPIAGPLVGLWQFTGERCDGNHGGFCGVDGATHHTHFVHALLALDAAAQVTGVGLAALGWLWKQRVPVDTAVAVAPWASPTGGGLVVAGQF